MVCRATAAEAAATEAAQELASAQAAAGNYEATAAAAAAGLRERLWAAEEQVRLSAAAGSTYFAGFCPRQRVGLGAPLYAFADVRLREVERKCVGSADQCCGISCLLVQTTTPTACCDTLLMGLLCLPLWSWENRLLLVSFWGIRV